MIKQSTNPMLLRNFPRVSNLSTPGKPGTEAKNIRKKRRKN